MAADGVKESLTVYEMATEHLRKATEVLDRLESASSMASDANDTTEVVSNNIAQSLFLCKYIKSRVPSLSPEPQRAQWNGVCMSRHFISLDPLGENQITFCIHRGKELGPNPSSDLGQSQAGSMTDTISPPAGHCGTLVLPPAIDLGLPLAITSEVSNFGDALAEFGSSELAQGLEEEVRNEYVALCKRMMCLPHESETARYYAMEGIPLMVKVLRQMKTIDIRKDGLTSIKDSVQLLEDYGFECKYFNFVFEKIISAQESFRQCEKEEDELRARMVALDRRFRMFQGTL